MGKRTIKILILFMVVLLLFSLINTTIVNSENSSRIKEIKQRIEGLESNKKELENDIFQIRMKIDLISYWSFDNKSVKDIWGNNDGINRGAVYTPKGKFGGAYEFYGGSYIEVENNNNLNFGTSDFTISLWIKTTNKIGAILSKSLNGVGYKYKLLDGWGGTSIFWFEDGNNLGNDYTYVTKDITDGKWHHVVGIVNRTEDKVQIYVDGDYYPGKGGADISTAESYDNSANLYIGSSEFKGSIDEIKIWNRALYPKEVKYLATKKES